MARKKVSVEKEVVAQVEQVVAAPVVVKTHKCRECGNVSESKQCKRCGSHLTVEQ